ncbi:Glutaredoxin domain-containing protein [Trichostrongylus colubriformis]|uniref:Glutaredoxin domain-containing protein n=1 Tax=Trichostrongylus colubriformis TaxID=6319 RepID=A0AAN8FL19_TRICO
MCGASRHPHGNDKRTNDCFRTLVRPGKPSTVMSLTGARSVPRVFINQKFIGGGDETAVAAKNGTLAKLLKEAQAI